MKKKYLIIISLLLLAVFYLFGSEKISTNDFQYIANIDTAHIEVNNFYFFDLLPEIQSKINNYKGDLYLIGDADEIPFVIVESQAVYFYKNEEKLEIFDYNAKEEAIFLQFSDKEIHPLNRIKFQINERDFVKEISFFGSNDLKKWELIKQDKIFDYTSKFDLRKKKMEFQEVGYKYFKLQMGDFKIPKEENYIFDFSSDASIYFSAKKLNNFRINAIYAESEKENIRAEFLSYNQDFEIENSGERSLIYFKSDVDFDSLLFDFKDNMVERSISIFEKKDNLKYNRLRNSSLVRFVTKDEKIIKDKIALPGKKGYEYKIEIVNNQSKPLDIKKIDLIMKNRKLIFMADKKYDNLKLYFGNSYVKPISYDLIKFINQQNYYEKDIRGIKINSIEKNEDFKKSGKFYFEKINQKFIFIGLFF